jgi:LuxR family maltose regulon positive regulatory protein
MRRFFIDCMAGLAMAYQAHGQQENADAALENLFQYCHGVDDVGALALASSCQRRLQLPSTPAGGVDMTQPFPDDATVPTENMFFWLEVPAITRCRELMAMGNVAGFREAEKRLRALLEFNEARHNRCQAIQITPLLALSVHRQGRADESLEILEKGIRLGEPGGWIRPFVEAGPSMVELLEQLQKRDIAPGYIGRLLSAFKGSASAAIDQGAQTVFTRPAAPPPLVEPLTNREQDILELLARRWQNKEIAARLGVSPETVKSHLKHIYQKLDAPNRIKAVEKARQLGLLPEK